MNLVLIGYRGTGKTSVARCLAALLGWQFADTDAAIQQSSGRTIAHLFATDGESVFREMESSAIAELVKKDRQVIAAGGGALLKVENRNALCGCGDVVWLKATAETIARRLANDPLTPDQRPNLTASGGLQEIRQLLAEREVHYRQCATLEVDTEDKPPENVAHEILVRLGLTP